MTTQDHREAFEKLADCNGYPLKGRDRDIAEVFWEAAMRYRDELEKGHD